MERGRDQEGGTGAGVPSPLELRVGRLEDEFREMKSGLKSIEAKLGTVEVSIARLDGRLAGIEGRLQSMPTAWQLFTALITTWAAGAAIVVALLRFAPK
jgi:hypothetical protein